MNVLVTYTYKTIKYRKVVSAINEAAVEMNFHKWCAGELVSATKTDLPVGTKEEAELVYEDLKNIRQKE